MKLLIPLLFLVGNAYASIAEWKISEVKDSESSTLGYVYYSEAIGTQSTITEFRIICSTNPSYRPLLSIFWDKENNIGPTKLTIIVDDKIINYNEEWIANGPHFQKNTENGSLIINSMKSGKVVNISWTGIDSVKRNTTFDIRRFSNKLGDFEKFCNLKF